MKKVFITGAAIGQGNLMAKRLAGMGWQVFAGVLPGASTDLAGKPSITIVEQDVSNSESVRKSAEVVRKAIGDSGLDVLMNIAGVADMANGVVECFSVENAQRQFEINTWGQLRTIQSFLPMLRQARPAARIINYGSGAILVNPPFAGAYNMSKHAIHGMTLTLRHELASFGIQVTTIMPGGVKTAMTVNSHERSKKSWAQMPQEMQRVYGPSLENALTKVLPDLLEGRGSTPEAVTEEVVKLLDVKKFKPFYLVGSDARPMGPMRRFLSDMRFESLIRSIYKIPSAKA